MTTVNSFHMVCNSAKGGRTSAMRRMAITKEDRISRHI